MEFFKTKSCFECKNSTFSIIKPTLHNLSFHSLSYFTYQCMRGTVSLPDSKLHREVFIDIEKERGSNYLSFLTHGSNTFEPCHIIHGTIQIPLNHGTLFMAQFIQLPFKGVAWFMAHFKHTIPGHGSNLCKIIQNSILPNKYYS